MFPVLADVSTGPIKNTNHPVFTMRGHDIVPLQINSEKNDDWTTSGLRSDHSLIERIELSKFIIWITEITKE